VRAQLVRPHIDISPGGPIRVLRTLKGKRHRRRGPGPRSTEVPLISVR
jgi:hypothetical protein